MKNFKKFLTLVLAVMMVVSSVAFSTSAATTKFEDVDTTNETLVKAVDLLSYMGVAKGTSETTFGADELVTRQQFALFIYRLMKGGKDAPAGAANSTKFTDLEDPTYTYAIAWANAEGIVNGKSATTFAPKDPIKLQEAYAMIVRALDWEEEKELVYPFGHIGVAEQDGVELDNGLDADVDYADELTRGDMAILLYNAFFAETGVEETYTVEKEIGKYVYDDDENLINTPTWVLQEYTTNQKLCEKEFGVVEVEYKATGTPNYKLYLENSDSEAIYDGEATYDLGYDAIYFEKVDGSEVNAKAKAVEAPQSAYIKAEDLGMDATELNAAFMGEFTLFVTLDDDNDIEKVLFADCNMTKKTVTDIKLGEVSSNKATSYFEVDGEKTDAKLLSGKLVAGDEEMYVFNAPYSYAKPVYGTVSGAAEKYNLRNEKNLKAINFFMDKEDETKIYTVEISDIVADGYEEDGIYTEQAEDLVEALTQVYYGGLYEADLYDVDGDALYDYISYKPYCIFQVDDDEDCYFLDDSFTTSDDNGDGYYDEDLTISEYDLPYIYTQEADVIAEVDYASEDVVIGYYSQELELVKIAAVVKPTVDRIVNAKPTAGTLTLGSGDKVDGVSAWKLVANFAPEDVVFDAEDYNDSLIFDEDEVVVNELFKAEQFDSEDELELYIYDGVVLFTSDVSTFSKFTENLIIPVTYADNNEVDTLGVEFGGFDSETGERAIYIHAWVDGKEKYVQVLDDEDIDGDYDVVDGDTLVYDNMLCTYEVKDGVYYITPLEMDVYDEDEKLVSKAIFNADSEIPADDFDGTAEEYILEDEKTEKQFFANLGDGLSIQKVAGTRFNIVQADDLTTKVLGYSVELKSYSKIVIREWDADDSEYYYHVYDASNFKKSLDEGVSLDNVKVILSNNKDSKSKENLVLLYAETDDFEFKGDTDKNGYRIVSNYDLVMTEDGEWTISYEVYDPYTGAKVYDVPSVDTAAKASSLTALKAGTIVDLVDGAVDDDSRYVIGDEAALVGNTANLVWITEVDTADGYFAVVPYAELSDREAVEEYVVENAEEFANDIEGEAIESNFIDYDKNTVVSVMSYGEYNSAFWNWGTMSVSSMDAVAAAKKDVLCYNDEATDRNGNYVTKYADYVKAFVSVDRDVDNDENPVAEFVIVIVNGDETAALDAE